MEQHQPLLHAIYYLLAATIAVPLFRRFGLGAILGYLVAGAIIGPQELGLIYETEATFKFSELGVVMLFAMAGMAAGGWLGGFIFDATLSYMSAFQSALAFNLLNLIVLLFLVARRRDPGTRLAAA